jgi:hypothetical protein
MQWVTSTNKEPTLDEVYNRTVKVPGALVVLYEVYH